VYDDGSTCTDHIQRVVGVLKRVRETKPSLRLHVEFDTIPSREVRRDIAAHVLPHVYSFGLNEVELEYLADDMELPISSGAIASSMEALVSLMNRTGLQRIHFHDLGYYVCLRRDRAGTDTARDALLLAATVAADRARSGEIRGDRTEDLVVGLSVSTEGLDRMRELAAIVENPVEFLRSGIAAYRGYTLLCIPTIVVEHPVLTVGLGDTISAVAFLAEG
jgi:ADP-dependent phosphofructokinase/glucokinase